MKTQLAMFAALGLVGALDATAGLAVPGTADPWLAGMPDGATASFSDAAPAQSPVLVTGVAFAAGDRLTFTTTGATDHCDGGICGLAGPEGDLAEGAFGHATGAENGIATLTAPIDGLIGVFLADLQPDLTGAPAALSFPDAAARDFAALSPELKQPFFIGDGRRNDGTTVQTFVVPAGATRLFLGTMDGHGWFNNVGSFDVTVARAAVPAPAGLALGVLALCGLVGGGLAGGGLVRGRPPAR